MNISSYMTPCFIECEEETPDDENLVAFSSEELKRKCVPDVDRIGVGQRLIRGAVESLGSCSHNWGMAHFWRNPKMLPPCQVTKIDGVWYRRKSCEHLGPPEEWNYA